MVQHSLNLVTSEIKIRLLEHLASVYFLRKRKKDDTHRGIYRKRMNWERMLEKSNLSFAFCKDTSNFCTTHIESELNDDTAQHFQCGELQLPFQAK